MAQSTDPALETFKKLKVLCVPLLGSALLTPLAIPTVSKLLSDLVTVLKQLDSSELTLPLIHYTFVPLSSILQRNALHDISDQILEKLFVALAIVCESWWWNLDLKVWDQLFMLCGAVIGGIEGTGNSKKRDDETKEASAKCLFSLLHARDERQSSGRGIPLGEAISRMELFRNHSQSESFVPILGQTLHSLLSVCTTSSLGLQLVSLDLTYILIGSYAPDSLLPSVLPGVTSTMIHTAFGKSENKTWSNGEVVAGALKILSTAISRSIGDEICVKEGAIQRFEDLEDLARVSPGDAGNLEDLPAYATQRTSSWLRGTASQLHIAINSLAPLVSHPAATALRALTDLSYVLLKDTSLTLPQTQPLLLSFLLSLSNSTFASVSRKARESLLSLFKLSSHVRTALLQTLLHIISENLSALPRLLSSQEDSKIEHCTGIIEATCRLIEIQEDNGSDLLSISIGIGRILGPTGGIEKWGFNLLSTLELVEPIISVTHTSAAQLMLENNPDDLQTVPFSPIEFKNVSSRTAREALERMFHALGYAAGDKCLYSVEWFTNIGRANSTPTSIAALWCACRLLEGVSCIKLSADKSIDWSQVHVSKRLEKLARSMAKTIGELWDDKSDPDIHEPTNPDGMNINVDLNEIQYQKGLVPVSETLKIVRATKPQPKRTPLQLMLQRSLCLQLISITSGILQSRFTSLFIYIIYPVLHSLVSPMSFLSSTALATLNFITLATSHASPANLLLSNFDYCLDAVSRRLTRRWLDIDATKVLVIMVRLVGHEIVDRAEDVVDECFDRLDDYHGYSLIVEGLIEVLVEVIKVIETEKLSSDEPKECVPEPSDDDSNPLDDFLTWLNARKELLDESDDEDPVDYGPAPRKAWGSTENVKEEEESTYQEPDLNEEPPPTSVQALTKQIIVRSMYFLTHGSPVIRARILTLLTLSVTVLPESALLPCIHSAWPFILNRLNDHETFVISAASSLIEGLATNFGDFMSRRIWDDIWPRFKKMLAKLDAADSISALARRDRTSVGTESAYTHSHRLYRSILKTMTPAMQGSRQLESSGWEVIVAFRRFLDSHAHPELQKCAVELYVAAQRKNPDAVWLALTSTSKCEYPVMAFMEARWDIDSNLNLILPSPQF